jgi:methyl-accepting chemotaxis protein
MMLFKKSTAIKGYPYQGTIYLRWLNFQGKVWLAAFVFMMAVLLMGFFLISTYQGLKQDLLKDEQIRETALSGLKTISELSPSLLSRCQAGLSEAGEVDTSDIRESLTREIAGLKAILLKSERKAPGLTLMIARYDKLNSELERYNYSSLTVQQYSKIKKIYHGYDVSLAELVKQLLQNRYGKFFILLHYWDKLLMALAVLTGLLIISGILMRTAAESITIPAQLMTTVFNAAKQKVFNIELPISTREGLGNAAFIVKDSLLQWNSKFLNSKNSIFHFDSLCKELVTEIRKTELFAIQLQKVAEALTENFDNQSHLIIGAHKQLATLVVNSEELHEVPQRLTLTNDNLRDKMAIMQDQIQEISDRNFEYQDESVEIADLAEHLNMASQKIKGVIIILNDVAERTEMLAFNAAIQAARAGEKGLGFGVVAKEIAKLVDHSKKASLQLNTLLSKISIKNEYILKLIHENEKAPALEISIEQEVLKICNNLFLHTQNGLSDIEKLSKVMEAVFTQSSQLSDQANMIVRFTDQENIGPVNFDLETLDYQLNVKEANRIAIKVSEISEELRTLAETASGEGDFLY